MDIIAMEIFIWVIDKQEKLIYNDMNQEISFLEARSNCARSRLYESTCLCNVS